MSLRFLTGGLIPGDLLDIGLRIQGLFGSGSTSILWVVKVHLLRSVQREGKRERPSQSWSPRELGKTVFFVVSDEAVLTGTRRLTALVRTAQCGIGILWERATSEMHAVSV